MSEQIKAKIISHLQSGGYQPTKPRGLARELRMEQEEQYPAFRAALKELMSQGRIVLGGSGSVVLPSQKVGKDEFVGSYRHNKRGFGFVIPTDPSDHEDLYIPEGENGGAINGDIVRAKITSRGQRDGKTIYTGRITEILERTNARFVGSLSEAGDDVDGVAGRQSVHRSDPDAGRGVAVHQAGDESGRRDHGVSGI